MRNTYMRAAAMLCAAAGVCLVLSACSGKAVVKRKEGAPTQYQPASAISSEAESAAASVVPEVTPEQSAAAEATAASSTAAESEAVSSEVASSAAASSEEVQATPAPTPTPTPAPRTVSVAYSVSGNGWIEGTNPADVMPGATAPQVFVHPDAGWHLDHWEIGGITTSTQEAISVTVPADFTSPVFSAVAILVSDS